MILAGRIRIAWLVSVLAGVATGGCDRLEKICAGPCVKAEICNATLPVVWIGGLSLPDADCIDSCTDTLSLIPRECQTPAGAVLDCYSQLGAASNDLSESCKALEDGSTFAYACGTQVLDFFYCTAEFESRCCRGDDPCGRADNGDCECWSQPWDTDDCLAMCTQTFCGSLRSASDAGVSPARSDSGGAPDPIWSPGQP